MLLAKRREGDATRRTHTLEAQDVPSPLKEDKSMITL